MPVTNAAPKKTYEEMLHEAVADYYADPLGFVLFNWSWGEKGTWLERHEGPDTWQHDFLGELGEEIRKRGFDGLHTVTPVRMAASSGHGIGKAQPVSLMLHTPTGYRAWGELQVGDCVFGLDGRPTRIIAVHDRGVLPVYRVSFDDGSSTRCCADHLWTVKGRQARRNDTGWQTLKTSELQKGVLRANGKSRAKQWQLPRIAPIEYTSRPHSVPPYLLGVWLGDGARNHGSFTNIDMELIERMRELGEVVTKSGQYTWGVKGLRKRLAAIGILDKYSYQKSVPAEYMEASAFDRAELLRGLLDTDGECSKQGSILFSSTSHALASDVVWLVRSLGGKAQFQPTVKKPTYPGPNGELLSGRDCWRVTIRMPEGFQCFYVNRKQARVNPCEGRYLHRWMSSIELDGEEECRCITVDAPDSLYLTNDCIPTHNSVMAAFLATFLMSTRPHAKGVVTANTSDQLRDKTWATIRRWALAGKTGHWFEINTERMYHKAHPASWFCSAQTCREENSEAFAGQHAADSSSFYINDEDSNVPDKIHEVQWGGLTDGEPFQFLFGNATRNYGAFYDACFGKMRHRYIAKVIDSRTSRFTNKEEIAALIQDHGLDSDRVRVRVLGLPPAASDAQYISTAMVQTAQGRAVQNLGDEPLVVGLDIARGGEDNCVFWFRRGTDARTIPPIVVPGEQMRDSMRLVTLAADILTRAYDGHRVALLAVDATGVGGPIGDRLRQMGHLNVIDVQFGGDSPDPQIANMRGYIWKKMRDWLTIGALPDAKSKFGPIMETDLTGPGYTHDKRDRLLLESKEAMKKDGKPSPDYGDALALTFAAVPQVAAKVEEEYRPKSRTYMGG